MDEEGLKELTESAFIIPCSSKSFSQSKLKGVPRKRRSTRSNQSQSRPGVRDQEDASPSPLSLAFPRIDQCENDDLPSTMRRKAYIECCNEVERAVERALGILYEPALAEIQEVILFHHEHATLSLNNDEDIHCSLQEAFFVPGEQHVQVSSFRTDDSNKMSGEREGRGGRIRTAVLAGSISSPKRFLSQISEIASARSSEESISPTALLVSLPSSSCASLSQALKTINLRFRSAWSASSASTQSQYDQMEMDGLGEEDNYEDDEIDSGSKKKRKGLSSGVEEIKRGRDLDGKDLKSWWISLPSPRPALILHLPSLESFDPFPLSDLILSLHSLSSETVGQESLPLSVILGLSTSRKALNSILPWATIEKLEVSNIPLPSVTEIWEQLMQELFLNPLHPLTVQIDFRTIEFMRIKYFEMDADANDVLRAFQLSYLHHFTSRPISSFAFAPSSSSITELSDSLTEEYIWSLRKSFLNDIIQEDETEEPKKISLKPPLKMLEAVKPLLEQNSDEDLVAGEESELKGQASKLAFSALSQILRDPSPAPLLLAMSTKETISKIRTLKCLSAISILREALLLDSRESAIASGLRSSQSKVPSKIQILAETLKTRSEDLDFRSKGTKTIKQLLSKVDKIICKTSSETESLTSEDSAWTERILSDLLVTIEGFLKELRAGLRSSSSPLAFMTPAGIEEEKEKEGLGSDSEEDVEKALEPMLSKKQRAERKAEEKALSWIVDLKEEVKAGIEELQSKMEELEEVGQTEKTSASPRRVGNVVRRDHDLVLKEVNLKDEIQEIRKKISKTIRNYLDDSLLPDRQPFETIHLTQFSRTLSHTLNSQERSNLSLALDNPQHVLRDLYSASIDSSDQLNQDSRRMIELLDEAELIGMKPDVVRAYKAYREAGTLINLGDWWEMWKRGVEDSEERWKNSWASESRDHDEEEHDDDDAEENEGDTTIGAKRKRASNAASGDSPRTPSKKKRLDSSNPITPVSGNQDVDTPSSSRSQRLQIRSLKSGPETSGKRVQEDLQARFAIAVNHLAMMGLLKKTSRRPEHSMRTNWEIPPMVAKQKSGKASRE